MEAGSVRQSKERVNAGHEDTAPEKGLLRSTRIEDIFAARSERIPESASKADTSVSWPGSGKSTLSLQGFSWLGWETIAAVLGGLILRLWMLRAFPQVSGDALIYGGIARNILLHGQFAITDGSGVVHPTLIRLPGYPLFLAACFRVFGIA